MTRFWWLLGLAFVDLVVVGAMMGRGNAPLAYLFLLMAVGTAAFALFSPPPQRDARGRLQPSELPYGKLIGVVGAVAILGSAAYVATVSSSPTARPVPARAVAAPTSPVATPTYSRPVPTRPAPRPEGLLYKCVAADGHASYQSQPCPADSEQAWVRDATPEAGPSAAQLAQQRRRQALENERARRQAAASNRVYWEPPQETGSSNSAACQAARAADAAYRRQPLKYVTHDGLRRHGDAVLAACN